MSPSLFSAVSQQMPAQCQELQLATATPEKTDDVIYVGTIKSSTTDMPSAEIAESLKNGVNFSSGKASAEWGKGAWI